jgi:hypothetical protein
MCTLVLAPLDTSVIGNKISLLWRLRASDPELPRRVENYGALKGRGRKAQGVSPGSNGRARQSLEGAKQPAPPLQGCFTRRHIPKAYALG